VPWRLVLSTQSSGRLDCARRSSRRSNDRPVGLGDRPTARTYPAAAISATSGGRLEAAVPRTLPPRGRQYPRRSARPIARLASSRYQHAVSTTALPTTGRAGHRKSLGGPPRRGEVQATAPVARIVGRDHRPLRRILISAGSDPHSPPHRIARRRACPCPVRTRAERISGCHRDQRVHARSAGADDSCPGPREVPDRHGAGEADVADVRRHAVATAPPHGARVPRFCRSIP